MATSIDGYNVEDVAKEIYIKYSTAVNIAKDKSEKIEPLFIPVEGEYFVETPAKSYKKLALASKIKGEPIEFQSMLFEKFDYWREVFLREFESTGGFSGATLERFKNKYIYFDI